jgi:hypothetical protein
MALICGHLTPAVREKARRGEEKTAAASRSRVRAAPWALAETLPRAPPPSCDYSLGAFAAWLRDLLDELGITVSVYGQDSIGSPIGTTAC